MTDTVVVRIIAKPIGLWLAYDQAEDSVFDSILVGTTACRDYKVHNYTGGSVTVTDLHLDGIFSAGGPWQKGTHFSVSESPTLPHTIANDDSMSFSICYTPPVAAVDNDTLLVLAGDSVLKDHFIGTSYAPASVKRTSEEDRVSVFPNPSSSRIYISGLPDGESFTIIDALGRQLVRGILRSDFIDIPSCSTGLYTIVFRTGERASFIKLEP